METWKMDFLNTKYCLILILQLLAQLHFSRKDSYPDVESCCCWSCVHHAGESTAGVAAFLSLPSVQEKWRQVGKGLLISCQGDESCSKFTRNRWRFTSSRKQALLEQWWGHCMPGYFKQVLLDFKESAEN